MGKLPRRHPWQTSVVFLGMLAVFADTLGDAGNVAAIVAAVASMSIVAGGSARWLRRRWLFRHPVKVFYVGGDNKPRKTWTTERLGRQYLMINICARLDVRVEQVIFAFYGAMADMPEDCGTPDQRESAPSADAIGELPRRVSRATHDPEDLARFPRLMPKRELILYPRHVVAVGPWEGAVELRFIVHTLDGLLSKSYVKRLPFSVPGVER